MCSSRALNAIMGIFWLTSSSLFLLGASIRLLDDHHNEEDLISKACNRTLYIDMCVSSLRSDPRSSTTSDLRGLVDIALNISIVHGMETVAYVKQLNSNNGNSTGGHDPASYTSGCLRDCVEEYEDAVQSLRDSVHQLRIRYFEKVNILVSAVMTDSETCEDGFMEVPDGVSPLTQRNQYFYISVV